MPRNIKRVWQASAQNNYGGSHVIGNYPDLNTAERACVKDAKRSLHWIRQTSKSYYANDPKQFYTRYTVNRIRVRKAGMRPGFVKRVIRKVFK